MLGLTHCTPSFLRTWVPDIVPIACHGADAPRNMQWQTVADAEAKGQVGAQGVREVSPPVMEPVRLSEPRAQPQKAGELTQTSHSIGEIVLHLPLHSK